MAGAQAGVAGFGRNNRASGRGIVACGAGVVLSGRGIVACGAGVVVSGRGIVAESAPNWPENATILRPVGWGALHGATIWRPGCVDSMLRGAGGAGRGRFGAAGRGPVDAHPLWPANQLPTDSRWEVRPDRKWLRLRLPTGGGRLSVGVAGSRARSARVGKLCVECAGGHSVRGTFGAYSYGSLPTGLRCIPDGAEVSPHRRAHGRAMEKSPRSAVAPAGWCGCSLTTAPRAAVWHSCFPDKRSARPARAHRLSPGKGRRFNPPPPGPLSLSRSGPNPRSIRR